QRCVREMLRWLRFADRLASRAAQLFALCEQGRLSKSRLVVRKPALRQLPVLDVGLDSIMVWQCVHQNAVRRCLQIGRDGQEGCELNSSAFGVRRPAVALLMSKLWT